MKVMIITNSGIGLYKFRKELIEALMRENEVYICMPQGDFSSELCALGARLLPCSLLSRHGINPVREIGLFLYYKHALKREKPDIVFTYTIKPNVYGGMACACIGIPYVANITGLGTAIENHGIVQRIALLLYKCGLIKAKKVFFQNKDNQDYMISRGIVRGEYDLLPGSGVNLSAYTVSEYPSAGSTDFVFVARIVKEKGIDLYLDAARIIRKRYPHTRFHVCGLCEQAYESILEKYSREGTIIYHGDVRNMTMIYRQMNCVVHPSYYPEGLSNVLLEAAASGRPIITTNRSGCREVVDNGINGFLVKERSVEDLVDKIELFLRLTHEEQKQMGLAGRKKVEKEFDRQLVVNKYLAELK